MIKYSSSDYIMYQFEWPKSDPIEQALRKVQLFCEKYYPNGYTELDLETLIQLGYQTGQYSGLAGIINASYDDWVRYLVDLINAKHPRSMHVEIFLDYGYRGDNYKIDTIETKRPVICIHKKRVHQIPKILNNHN